MAAINRKWEAERLGDKYSSFSQEPDNEQVSSNNWLRHVQVEAATPSYEPVIVCPHTCNKLTDCATIEEKVKFVNFRIEFWSQDGLFIELPAFVSLMSRAPTAAVFS
jgi:hypothetical protein